MSVVSCRVGRWFADLGWVLSCGYGLGQLGLPSTCLSIIFLQRARLCSHHDLREARLEANNQMPFQASASISFTSISLAEVKQVT